MYRKYNFFYILYVNKLFPLMTNTIALDHENKRLLLKIKHTLRDVEDLPHSCAFWSVCIFLTKEKLLFGSALLWG